MTTKKFLVAAGESKIRFFPWRNLKVRLPQILFLDDNEKKQAEGLGLTVEFVAETKPIENVFTGSKMVPTPKSTIENIAMKTQDTQPIKEVVDDNLDPVIPESTNEKEMDADQAEDTKVTIEENMDIAETVNITSIEPGKEPNQVNSWNIIEDS
jgi:hypothetical protein